MPPPPEIKNVLTGFEHRSIYKLVLQVRNLFLQRYDNISRSRVVKSGKLRVFLSDTLFLLIIHLINFILRYNKRNVFY